jgi:HAD superfamily hydrolase (TIGR01450 family)
MRFSDFDAILFDMDGTLYREHHALPGVAGVLGKLRGAGHRMACITNNSANTSAELSQRLAKMGVEAPPEAIFTACHAMVDAIAARWTGPRVFNFAGRALPVELAGRATLVERVEDGCDAVAVGTHFRENAVPFDFERSLVGLNLLKRGAHLVVGCGDRVFPIQGGGVEFGSGSWGALFTFAADLPAERVTYAGKPEPGFFLSLCGRMKLDPKRCLIVGDNLESDIQGGQSVGMATALVLTGITTAEEARGHRIKPDLVVKDLEDLWSRLKMQ